MAGRHLEGKRPRTVGPELGALQLARLDMVGLAEDGDQCVRRCAEIDMVEAVSLRRGRAGYLQGDDPLLQHGCDQIRIMVALSDEIHPLHAAIGARARPVRLAQRSLEGLRILHLIAADLADLVVLLDLRAGAGQRQVDDR